MRSEDLQKYWFGLFFLMFLLSACVSNKDVAVLNDITKENSKKISEQHSILQKNIQKQNDFFRKNRNSNLLLLNKIDNLQIKFDSLNIKIIQLQKKQLVLENQIKILKKKKITNKKSKSEILYYKGLTVYRKKNYRKALSIFREFLLKYPKNKFSPNAQYWIGECYYSQNKFEKAKDEFQNVLDYYPKSPKAPDAQVKIGIIYFKQNKKEQSLLELNRVLKMYPDYERREMVKSLIEEYK